MDTYDGAPSYVGELCRTDSRRALLEFVYERWKEGDDSWLRVNDLIEETGLSRNAVIQNREFLIDVELVETSENGRFTQYRPSDSESMRAVESANEELEATSERDQRRGGGIALTDLYGSESRQRLADFFLWCGLEWDAAEDEPLTKSDVHEMSGVTRKSIVKHIDVLVDYGIVDVNIEHTYDRYKPAVKSPSFDALIQTNETLAQIDHFTHS